MRSVTFFFPVANSLLKSSSARWRKHPFYQFWAISVNLRVPLPNTHLYTHSFPFSGLREYQQAQVDQLGCRLVLCHGLHGIYWDNLFPFGLRLSDHGDHGHDPMSKRTQLLLLPSQRAPPTLPWPCASEGKFRSSQPHGPFFSIVLPLERYRTSRDWPQDSFLGIHQPLNLLLLWLSFPYKPRELLSSLWKTERH